MPKNKLYDTALVSSFIFTIFSILFNTISWIFIDKKLLKLSYSYLILIVINIIVGIIIYCRKSGIKYNIIKKYLLFSTFIYTITSIFTNTLVCIIKMGDLWKIYSIFLILIFSFVISAMIIWLRKKGFIFNIISYFIVIGIFYYLLIITIAGFGKGNKSFVLMIVYVLIYIIFSIILTIIRNKKINSKNDLKPYKNQF